mmetsp:Transcript_43947/g.88647  ORF Transcript_43947/g.88647 Transcript_43947/m.88647 type:complete len:80 (+) Transcript_43947:803-1042(+)
MYTCVMMARAILNMLQAETKNTVGWDAYREKYADAISPAAKWISIAPTAIFTAGQILEHHRPPGADAAKETTFTTNHTA